MLTATRVYSYSRRFQDAYDAVMKPLSDELAMPQTALDILLFLANNPDAGTAKDVCTYRHLKPAIVSFHVERLVREGYLARQSVPEDRRKCRLVCTGKAAQIVEKGRAAQDDFSRKLSRGLTAEELEICQRCFAVFEQNMGRILTGGEAKKETES